MSADDLSNLSLHELFVVEVENQSAVLTDGLLKLERGDHANANLEALMRAAHSLKGAARIVDLDVAVKVAHAMEDCFVAAQNGGVVLRRREIDLLLKGVDLLVRISKTPEENQAAWQSEKRQESDGFVADLAALLQAAPTPEAPAEIAESENEGEAEESGSAGEDRVLRVTANRLNRLLGLAGESLVTSRRFRPFVDSLLRLKRQQGDLARLTDQLRDSLPDSGADEETRMRLQAMQDKLEECRKLLSDRLGELEILDQETTNLSHRLYDEALSCRMRPFADGMQGFPRMVRDTARVLGKEARLEIVGLSTSVDRDVLEKLEAPLTHLLRNALDHGLESPEERAGAGKPREGIIRLEARHQGGNLQVIVSDDGRGIDLAALRQAVLDRQLVASETASKLSEAELLEFLFLPGFSMKGTVTELSGRGVGLDIVQNLIKQVRGTVRVMTKVGAGTSFQLQLPLTLSVVRALLVEIGGEPYAFPLAHVIRILKVPKKEISVLEGRQHFSFNGRATGLVPAHQVLERPGLASVGEELPVLLIGNREHTYGLVVEKFLQERDLVVHPLDSRLGKIKNISAGALMEDGFPALIIDAEDMIHSIEKLVSSGPLNAISSQPAKGGIKARKRVLVVDDSLTVREVERKLLASQGYEVETATDGMNGWNAVRTQPFDLVITDVDMPRMDGIELVGLIKKNPGTKSLPVMIVSYKDRDQDRQRGLDAGADYYLTKGSFHDETLVEAVRDMIGEATS